MKASFMVLPSLLLSAAARRDDGQEAAAAGRQFVAAFNRGDATAAARIYSDHAKLLPPGKAAIEGQEAIRQYWQELSSRRIKFGALQDACFVQAGDLIYEIGCCRVDDPEDAQSPTHRHLRIWSLRRGAWRIDVDMWTVGYPPRWSPSKSSDAGSGIPAIVRPA